MSGPLIISGRESYRLAKEVAGLLGLSLAPRSITPFADFEFWYRLKKPVEFRGSDCFLIQSTPAPLNKTFFDLIGLMNAIKRQKPKKLTAFLPFCAGRRQEKEMVPGEAVMAQQLAEIIYCAGADEVVLCDPHAEITQNFFALPGHLYEKLGLDPSIPHTIPVQIIDANPLFLEALRNLDLTDYVVVTPDKGRLDCASRFAELAGLPLIQGFKLRPGRDEAITNEFQEGLRGKRAIIREDEISTAGTIRATVTELKRAGVVEVIVMATHGVLAGGAVTLLEDLDLITKVFITNTIFQDWEKCLEEKIFELSIAPLIAENIRRSSA